MAILPLICLLPEDFTCQGESSSIKLGCLNINAVLCSTNLVKGGGGGSLVAHIWVFKPIKFKHIFSVIKYYL